MKPLPHLAVKCINSWKRYFPDYEIKEWNESNFDVNIIPYTKEAYEAKRYAFVSDYARFWILYHYGGIYFDTDVEVIKPMNDIISKGAFMGWETAVKKNIPVYINPGLGIGCETGNLIYRELNKNSTLKIDNFLQGGDNLYVGKRRKKEKKTRNKRRKKHIQKHS